MAEFGSLSNRQQVYRVRRALVALLDKHGLAPDSLELAYHGFNTTFRFRNRDHDIAFRVNINSTREIQQVRGELAFVSEIVRQGNVRVPQPIPIFGGSAVTIVEVEGISPPKPVTAYQWVAGRHRSLSRPVARLLGQTLRGLQDAMVGFQLPDGADRPVLRDVLDGLPWRLTGSEFEEAREIGNAVLASMEGTPRQLVHFDLHQKNVKLHKGELVAFDFDDSVWSWPAVDLAQSLFYLRNAKGRVAAEAAFWAGFGRTPEDMGVSPRQIEALVAGRALLLVDDLAGTANQEFIAFYPKYLEVTRKRIRHFLKSGVFDPS